MNANRVSWRTMIARFARLGLLGFGGPTGHVVLMRRQWLDSGDLEVDEFNDAFAAVSLLPGPMSTQLAMWIGWRVRGYRGLLLAAALFVVPAVSMVLVLSSFVLGANHPIWLVAAALGAGAVVPAIALRAAIDIAGSYHVATLQRSRLIRLVIYVVVGVVVCYVAPGALPLAMIVGGFSEVTITSTRRRAHPAAWFGLGSTKSALAWMAFKIGALSFGGGFVIVPIMRGDAVTTHHWLTARAFVAVVAIGQLTPGPVVATVAAVGFAAGGFVDGALAAGIAFTPSLVMVGLGARHLDRLRTRPNVRSFLDGAGPVAAGAIGAAAVVLARACSLSWQWPLVVWAVVAVVWLRRSPTLMLTAGAATGLLLALVAHVPVS